MSNEMKGEENIDLLMIPVLKSIKRHVTSRDAITDIYNRAYEAVMISLDVKNEQRHIEFCPNCEADIPCTHEAELYVCDICGEDFAKYIVLRSCTLPDVSTTQGVLTGVKTPESIENPWIPISSGRLPNKFQECIVLDSSGHVHNWMHDDVLLPLFAQYTHWMPLPEPPEGA